MKKSTDTHYSHLAPYGLPEKIWIGAWTLVTIAVIVKHSDLDPFARAFSMSCGVLLFSLILPQITFRLGRMAQSLGRIGLSLATAIGGYETSAMMVAAVGRRSYEWEMIRIDEFLFGFQPSVAMQAIQHPVLTEFLQSIYMFYFPNMLLVGLAIIYARNHKLFYEYAAVLNVSFIVTHVSYVIVPLQSPFLLAEQGIYLEYLDYHTPLVGLMFTEGFRESLLNATTMRFDCFPSGHTMHSLIALFFAWRIRRDVGVVVTIFVVSIVFSTMYLRYHYAIDVVVGIAMAAAVYAIVSPIAKRQWEDEIQPEKQEGGLAAMFR